MRNHPLPSFFVLAYAGSWLVEVPLLLSQRGFGLINVPEPVLFIIFLFAAYFGSLLAAFVVTAATLGRPGVKQLLWRMGQWRVGILWYLVPILGYPLVYLVAYSFVLGAEPFTAFFQNWQLFFTTYIPLVLFGILFPSLGEEPGWRGFALPRLQLGYGPLIGSLILGILHGLWHLPAYFIPGAILPGRFDPTAFIANTCAIIALTFTWTWIFNNAKGSVLIAMIVHGASNASGYIFNLFTPPDDPWATFKIFAVVALIIIVLTRGRLSYNPNDVKFTTGEPKPSV